MKTRELFEKKEVFTRDELKQHLVRAGGGSSLKELIRYHLNQGNIGQVKRGLFFPVDAGTAPEDQPVDPFLVAAKASEQGVLGYHTALDLQGHAHSVYSRYYFVTPKAKNYDSFTFRENEFVPVQVSRKLLKKEKENLGVQEYDRKGEIIDVTSIERTLVDLLDRPRYGGGWEEIWRSTTGFGFLKEEEILEYVRALENKTTAAKVGFWLEQHREEYNVSETMLNDLEPLCPGQPHYMDRSYDRRTLVPRWNLIVPDYVLNRGWEEF